MSAIAATIAGRAAAEQLMVDTCIIDRKTGSVFDETTGQYDDTYTTVYQGKCRVQEMAVAGVAAEAGEQTTQLKTWLLQVPMAVTGVRVNDRVRVTATQLDPELIAHVWRVRDLMHKSHATARRLPIEEVTSR